MFLNTIENYISFLLGKGNYWKAFFCAHFHMFETCMSFMVCTAMMLPLQVQVKDIRFFFRFCLLISNQIMKSLMAEQLIKLDLYIEQCFFKSSSQKMSSSFCH